MGHSHSSKPSPVNTDLSVDDVYRQSSPPFSPGSPLTYTPQAPMEPIVVKQEDARPGTAAGAEYAGWVPQAKLMPVVILWGHGGEHVEVEGSFDNWTTRQPLARSGKDFTIIRLLAPGVYQFKFIVDGEWRYDPNQPAMFDEMGNVNNVIEVQEYVPENLEGLSGFDPPPSPPSSYSCPTPVPDDYAKEPPFVPGHLALTLLNVPPAPDPQTVLPRPQHVILNHLYCQRGANTVVVVGATHRFKSKYITSVMYMPKHRAPRALSETKSQ